jgi:DMSO reductase anchor subunit
MNTKSRSFQPCIPLLVFSALLPLAVASSVVAAALGFSSGGTDYDVGTFSLVALVAGVVAVTASLFHLGQKRRAPLALVGLGRSWLSREVLLAVVFVVLTSVAAGLAGLGSRGEAGRVTAGLAAATGIAAVLAIGRVYHLPGQVGWRGGPRVVGSLAATLLLSATLILIVFDGVAAEVLAGVVLILAAVDLLLAARRLLDLGTLVREHRAALTFPTLAPAGVRALRVRFALTWPAIVAALLAPPPWRSLALPLLCVAITLDRFALYAGSARRTPRIALEEMRQERLDQAATGE